MLGFSFTERGYIRHVLVSADLDYVLDSKIVELEKKRECVVEII
jgi:hypothetical protein